VEEEVTLDGTGNIEFYIDSAPINFIYRLEVEPDGANPWRLKLFDKDTYDDDDRAFDTGAQSGSYNSIDEGIGLIVCVDKDKSNQIHCKASGTAGDKLVVSLSLVRMK
jgi:hypothetical protein